MNITILGLTITSSWGNGHATTYRGLARALADRSHDVTFLEWDKPYYAHHRDLPDPPYADIRLYDGLAELREHRAVVADADLVMVGSYNPQGADVAAWALGAAAGPVVFYDIDTPVTIAALERGECSYLTRELVPRFDAYLSFTGGPTLAHLTDVLGARRAWPLYCSVDPEEYRPRPDRSPALDLGYLGTYSADRQPPLERLLLEPARRWREGRFSVAGPKYPDTVRWPPNVERVEHLPPREHADYYTNQRFTLNVTRADMVERGWSPSVRLFEAAACATPVLSDAWEGLDHFFQPGREIYLVHESREVLEILQGTPEEERRRMGDAARRRVLAEHTNAKRAEELEGYARRLQREEAPQHA